MAGGNSILDFIEKALQEVKGLDLEFVQRNVRATEPLTVEELEAIRIHCHDDYEFLEDEGLIA